MVTLGSSIHSPPLLGGKTKGLSANDDAEAMFFSLAMRLASCRAFSARSSSADDEYQGPFVNRNPERLPRPLRNGEGLMLTDPARVIECSALACFSPGPAPGFR